ncbi:hypothetical protein [Streptomyces sp. NPDC057910]|uniref:hypothetical protein n=1 Tax=Streptomyces sp. NPDC057910 TaxID=3346278 RepID=UPI0036EC5008
MTVQAAETAVRVADTYISRDQKGKLPPRFELALLQALAAARGAALKGDEEMVVAAEWTGETWEWRVHRVADLLDKQQ